MLNFVFTIITKNIEWKVKPGIVDDDLKSWITESFSIHNQVCLAEVYHLLIP
jgi:hypothetical protein